MTVPTSDAVRKIAKLTLRVVIIAVDMKLSLSSNPVVVMVDRRCDGIDDDDGGDDFYIHTNSNNFYVLANEVVLSKNGKYPERAEFVGINNIIFIFVQVLLTASVFIKIYLMIQKQELLWADVLVLLLLLMLWPLPLKYFNKYCRFN